MLKNIYVLFSPVGCKGILSLLDTFSVFSGVSTKWKHGARRPVFWMTLQVPPEVEAVVLAVLQLVSSDYQPDGDQPPQTWEDRCAHRLLVGRVFFVFGS